METESCVSFSRDTGCTVMRSDGACGSVSFKKMQRAFSTWVSFIMEDVFHCSPEQGFLSSLCTEIYFLFLNLVSFHRKTKLLQNV